MDEAMIVAGVLCAMLGGYVAGYFVLGERHNEPEAVERVYEMQWQCVIYRPAAQIESAITGVPTCTSFWLDPAIVW